MFPVWSLKTFLSKYWFSYISQTSHIIFILIQLRIFIKYLMIPSLIQGSSKSILFNFQMSRPFLSILLLLLSNLLFVFSFFCRQKTYSVRSKSEIYRNLFYDPVHGVSWWCVVSLGHVPRALGKNVCSCSWWV